LASAQVACTAQWQCSSVTTDYNYVQCSNGFCACRTDLGMDGTGLSPSSPCTCLSPKTVIWNNGSPYCVNLQDAVNAKNQKNKEALQKQTVQQIYRLLIGTFTPQLIAAEVINVDNLLSPTAVGRISPVGHFNGVMLKQYFYALAASSNITNTYFIDLRSEGNVVAVRVDVEFTHPAPSPYQPAVFNLTEKGFFFFNDQGIVEAVDLEILNLGDIEDPPSFLYPFFIAQVCNTINGNPALNQTQGTCNGANLQYADWNTCVAHLSSIPFGSFYRANSNTVVCRLIHQLMTIFPPPSVGANLHCPHVGPTGGGMCVDMPYSEFYTNDVYNPAGIP